MDLVIQMAMLVSGAFIVLFCKVTAAEINNGSVFKAGMTAIFAVFGVAWMADTFFSAHIAALQCSLGGVVHGAPWTYARPGLISVFTSCVVGYALMTAFL